MNSRLILLSAILSIVGCQSNDNHVTSDGLGSSSDRVAKLSEYLVLRTDVHDAEFDIFDVNIGAEHSIPGPTSRDYKIALLLDPADVAAWTDETAVTSFPLDYGWAQELTANNERFTTHFEPVMLTGENRQLILFEEEGVVFLRIRHE